MRRRSPSVFVALVVATLLCAGLACLVAWAFLSFVPDTPAPAPRHETDWENGCTGITAHILLASPDGKLLAWAGYCDPTGTPHEVGLISTADGEPERLRGLRGEIVTLAWSPDSSLLAVAAHNEPILLLRPADLKTVHALGEGGGGQTAPSSLAFSPDGKSLAAGWERGGVHHWDYRRSKPRLIREFLRAGAAHVVISREGGYLAAANDESIVVWDLDTGEEACTFAKPHISPHDWSPGLRGLCWAGWHLASTGADGKVRLWDIGAKKQAAVIDVAGGDIVPGSGAAPGKLLLMGSRRSALLSLPDGKEVAFFEQNFGTISAGAISPDGRFLYYATVSPDKHDPSRDCIHRFRVPSAPPAK